MYMHMYICMYMYIHMYTCMYMCIHMYIIMYMCMYCTCTCIGVYIHFVFLDFPIVSPKIRSINGEGCIVYNNSPGPQKYVRYVYIIHVHVSICLSIHLSICLSVWLSVYLCICLSIYLSVCLAIWISVHLCMYLSIYLYVYVLVYTFKSWSKYCRNTVTTKKKY